MPAAPESERSRATDVQMDAYRPAAKGAPKPAPEPKRPEPLDANPFLALLQPTNTTAPARFWPGLLCCFAPLLRSFDQGDRCAQASEPGMPRSTGIHIRLLSDPVLRIPQDRTGHRGVLP